MNKHFEFWYGSVKKEPHLLVLYTVPSKTKAQHLKLQYLRDLANFNFDVVNYVITDNIVIKNVIITTFYFGYLNTVINYIKIKNVKNSNYFFNYVRASSTYFAKLGSFKYKRNHSSLAYI